jgi:hypothetical protein
MAKNKIKKSKEEQKLSKEAIESIEHFFWCHPPKYFSRNLRSMIVDWMEGHSGGAPIYQEELLSQLTTFFPVLDLIEDEGKFDSEDYEINWGHKPDQ